MKRFDVTVVGELNLDVIFEGVPRELAPERELLASGLTVTLGSSSAILAHNLSALGSRVGFAAKIGRDPLGQMSLERLSEGGVDVSRVKTSDPPIQTGLTVILSHPESRNIITYPGAMHDLRFEDLDLDYLADARHFHLSSFFLHRGLLPRMPELFAAMKSAGLTTSLDVNDDPADQWDSGIRDVLKHVDIFFLNERELLKLTANADIGAGVSLLSRLVPLLVVKLGAKGALLRHDGSELRSAALPVEVVDAVGAGDSFDAGFLHQFVHGAKPQQCLEYANRAGAFSTTRSGGTTAFRDRDRVHEFFLEHPGRPPEPSTRR